MYMHIKKCVLCCSFRADIRRDTSSVNAPDIGEIINADQS